MKQFKTTIALVCTLIIFNFSSFAQDSTAVEKTELLENGFWKKVKFSGGLGLNVGGNFTEITVAPSGVYPINKFISLGLGIQYSYLKQKNFSANHLYGGSLISFYNPTNSIQLSAELEQLRVAVGAQGNGFSSQDYWNTSIFLGGGYRVGNLVIGGRYNVLFNKNKNLYGSAFMPFVRYNF